MELTLGPLYTIAKACGREIVKPLGTQSMECWIYIMCGYKPKSVVQRHKQASSQLNATSSSSS